MAGQLSKTEWLIDMAKINWKNSGGGDFAVGSNWSMGTVPGPSDIANINAAGVTSSANETVLAITTILPPQAARLSVSHPISDQHVKTRCLKTSLLKDRQVLALSKFQSDRASK